MKLLHYREYVFQKTLLYNLATDIHSRLLKYLPYHRQPEPSSLISITSVEDGGGGLRNER